jgi:ABC-type phosphate/phosphonate transport system substrate-binding protein
MHLAVIPSSVVGNITGYYPSVSDWEYQLLLSHGEYRSTVIFRRDTPIRDLSDLKRYTVAAPHERSSSGYKIPMGHLKERGIQPRIQFLDGAHSDVWRAVLRGHVKVGFTYDGFRDELPPEKSGRLSTIEIPIRIPGSVWVLREDVTKLSGLKSGARRALRDFVEENEDPYWRSASRPDAQTLTEYDRYRRIMNEIE